MILPLVQRHVATLPLRTRRRRCCAVGDDLSCAGGESGRRRIAGGWIVVGRATAIGPRFRTAGVRRLPRQPAAPGEIFRRSRATTAMVRRGLDARALSSRRRVISAILSGSPESRGMAPRLSAEDLSVLGPRPSGWAPPPPGAEWASIEAGRGRSSRTGRLPQPAAAASAARGQDRLGVLLISPCAGSDCPSQIRAGISSLALVGFRVYPFCRPLSVSSPLPVVQDPSSEASAWIALLKAGLGQPAESAPSRGRRFPSMWFTACPRPSSGELVTGFTGNRPMQPRRRTMRGGVAPHVGYRSGSGSRRNRSRVRPSTRPRTSARSQSSTTVHRGALSHRTAAP